ncbi:MULTISPECIES: prepilin-type N-terminal cleavage/methylation domain-containing protein [unclassified Paludibacterium]|uniref:prepilin-type N-terminal cleavage/methylation domain-containing protein n=1 Tax=unclassified Paludibacterium TaxID=2618429 RepID=UPI001C0509EE|nr:prepilin-type N-terminal cleavage/methylation domain-containing protein [Paludibacterium sp. B53371]BEV73362.1 GspH/FimT family pseudopilin [Paludibacterium sp. THUN1379]
MRGFTLLEVLVVMAIIGILTTTLTLSISPDTHRQLQEESYRLARMLEQGVAMAEEGDPLALRWQPAGYAFVRRDVAGRWQPAGDDFFAAHAWPEGVQAQILRAPAAQPWPLWQQGQSPWLVLRLTGGGHQVDLSLSPLGRVSLDGAAP